MEKILHIYYKYKRIIIIIIVIIGIFLLFKYNFNKSINNSRDSSSSNNTTAIAKNEENDINSNSKIKESTISSNEQAIEQFVTLCNKGNINGAYNMLSDDCKNALYINIEEFKNNYYNNIFETQKKANVTVYNNNTYRVGFGDDPITTGKVSNNESEKVDYITVGDEYKLNISSFIERRIINNAEENDFIRVKVLMEDVYVNYELYTISATNLSKADMFLDDINNSKIIVKYSNGNIYKLNIGEYSENDFKIASSEEKEIRLKFYKNYLQNIDGISMNFNNIRIKNKKYYDTNSIASNTTNGSTQEVIYQEKMTSYPPNVAITVKIK